MKDFKGWKNTTTWAVWVRLSNDEQVFNKTLKVAKSVQDLQQASVALGMSPDADYTDIFNTYNQG